MHAGVNGVGGHARRHQLQGMLQGARRQGAHRPHAGAALQPGGRHRAVGERPRPGWGALRALPRRGSPGPARNNSGAVLPRVYTTPGPLTSGLRWISGCLLMAGILLPPAPT